MSSSDRNPVELLAEEFLERYRRGDHPSVSQYTERHPEHAEAIRELFPVLLQMERARPDAGGLTDITVPTVIGREAAGDNRIGDYRIVREIGRGGMGVVYEAEQQSLGRRVALKILPLRSSQDDIALERFRREARAAAKLHHTNIVPVFDVGEEGQTCYYAMQYIQGQPLDLVVDELRSEQRTPRAGADGTTQPLTAVDVAHSLLTGQFEREDLASTMPVTSRQVLDVEETPGVPARHTTREVSSVAPEFGGGEKTAKRSSHGGSLLAKTDTNHRHYFCNVAELGRQVAEALSHAHARGVVHRDIKPANLLLDAAGVIWVTDFGMAKVDDEDLTHSGDILGTIRYMAPERFQGVCDARADVYALGLTLYELLVLRPAFDSPDRLQLIEMISNHMPVLPRATDPRIPRDLETIVLKAIEKDPQARYQTAREMSDDLESFLEDRPIRARRIGVAERFVRWTRRNPVVAGLSTAMAVLLVLAVVASSLAAFGFRGLAARESVAKERARAAENRAKANLAIADENAEQLRRQDYVSRVQLAYYESMDDNMARALELLNGCPTDLRGWEWDYVQSRCLAALRTLREQDPSVNCVAFGPQGKYLAIGTGNFLSRHGNPGALIVRNATTGEVRFAHRDLMDGVTAVAFSPDGSRIASGNGSDLAVWDAETGELLFAKQGESLDLLSLAFSPDGTLLAGGYGEFNGAETGYARVWDAITGEERIAKIPGHPGGVWSVAFHPAGKQLALTSEGLVEVWDLDSRESVLAVSGHQGFLYAVAYRPDGRYFASGGLDRTIRLWDAANGALVRIYRGHTGFVRGLAFSPDGKHIISASEDKSLRLWEFDTERELATFRGHTHFVNSVSFNHDGTIFASGSLDRTVKLWFAAADQQLVYRNHLDEGHVLGVAFSPSGNAVASSSFFFSGVMDRLHLWDPHTGEPLVRFPKNVGQIADVAFHPGSRHLAAGHLTGMVTIWDTRSGRLLSRLEGHIGRVWSVAFSPDGSRLASAGEDGGVNLWSTESGQLIYGLFGHREFVRDLEFSPDGQRLATASDDGTVKIWEVSSGKELFTYDHHEGEVTGVAFSPDGKWVASTGGVHHRQGGARIWNASTGRDVHVLEGHTDIVLDAAFSPDGRRLATASDDRTIKLWDTREGYEVFTLRGHTGGVISVRFSPDGRQIASGSVDRTVRIWENSPAKIDVLNRREAVAQAALGETHFDRQEWQEAISAYDRVLALGLDRADIHLRRGVAFLHLGASSSSEAEFAEAIRASGGDPQQLLELGSLFVQHGLPNQAVDVFGRAVTLLPDDFHIACALGRAHLELGQADEAVKAFTRAFQAWEKSAKNDLPHTPKWMETGWWIAGPFPGELNTPHAPETATMGDSRESFVSQNLHAIVAEMAGTSWQRRHTDGDGYLDLAVRLESAGQETVYAREHVFSPTEQQVALLIGWDDGIRLWVNGTFVYENRRSATARLGQTAVPVTLRPGWNTILAKGANYTGPHGLYVEISDLAKDRALAHTRRGELDRVLEVWADAAEPERDNPQLLALAGDAFARRAQWREAADVFTRLVERQPARNRNWVILAPLLVQVGDRDGYSRHCQRMLALYADTQNPMIAERTSKASLILPDILAASELPCELASRAVSQGANHRFVNFFELAQGIAYYRTGEHQRALETLEPLLARDLRDPYSHRDHRSVSGHDQSETRQARARPGTPAAGYRGLGRATSWRDSHDLGPGWSDWLICEIVRHEAEALLGVSKDRDNGISARR